MSEIDQRMDAFLALRRATAPGLSRRLTELERAKIADQVLSSAGRPLSSLGDAVVPWRTGWRAMNEHLRTIVIHQNGRSHDKTIDDISSFVEGLSDQSVAFCRRRLKLDGPHLFFTDRRALQSEMAAPAFAAFSACVAQLVNDGYVLRFEWIDGGLSLDRSLSERWGRPSRKRAPEKQRFLIADELPRKLLGGDKGGLRSKAGRDAEREAHDLIREWAAAERPPPTKASAIGYLTERIAGLSKNGAERAWANAAPPHWRKPGRGKLTLEDALPDDWPRLPR